MRIVPKITIALIALLLSASALTAANIVSVTQNHRAFSVASLQIMHGEVVRFVNGDLFLHQIYVDSPSLNFESDEQEPGTNVDITFSKTGLFQVRCHIHPKMLLQVEAH